MTRYAYALMLLLAALTIAATADQVPDTSDRHQHDAVGVADTGPCCTTCANQTGTAKYFSIVSFPAPACGEACIPPKKYKIYKIFEPHLLPANATDPHPCAAAGYSQYVKTVTHGVPGILSVTLDMYHKPSVSDSAIPSGCFEKHRTRASCDADAACSWCRGYEGHPSCAAWPGSLPPWQQRTCDKYKPTQAPTEAPIDAPVDAPKARLKGAVAAM